MNIHGDALCTLWNYNGNIHSLQSLLLSGTESSEAVTLTIISGYTLLLQRTPRLQLYSCIVSQGFLPWKIWVAFPRESQLQQSHATQPLVYAGCYSITSKASNSDVDYKLFHMHTDVNACDGTRGIRESALKVDSGRKIPCRTRESNLCQQRACPAIY